MASILARQHRVRNLSGVERYSIPFFMGQSPNSRPARLENTVTDASLVAEDGNSDILVEPTRGPMKGKVKGVTVESHLKNRFDASCELASIPVSLHRVSVDDLALLAAFPAAPQTSTPPRTPRWRP